MVALAPVGLEGIVQGLAGARLLLLLLAGLGAAAVAEVVGVRVQAQEADEAVQLTHPVLQPTANIRTACCRSLELPVCFRHDCR